MLRKNGRIIEFEFDEHSAKPVFLVGDFNNWDPAATRMRKGKNNYWRLKIELTPGKHQFKYYSNGNWYNDHRADKYVPDSLGGDNSVVIVTDTKKQPRTAKSTRQHKRKAAAAKR